MPAGDDGDDGDDGVESIIAPLVDDGVLARLGEDGDDRQRWVDCELCSLIEHRFEQLIEPAALTAADRETWSRVACAPGERLVAPRPASYRAGFWLLADGEQVGTIALATSMLSRRYLDVSSLYVRPDRRARGVAYRALHRLQAAVVATGHRGVRLATHWTWQATVRRYLLRYRMWAFSFKRSIDFVWDPELPRHEIMVGERHARFAIEDGAGAVTLLTATHDGAWLTLSEAAGGATRVDDQVGFYARSTFAVALALHGWPLLATPDELHAAAGGDIGGPSVLARKLAIFEWFDRRHGFAVRTPRIPCLPYDELGRELERDG